MAWFTSFLSSHEYEEWGYLTSSLPAGNTHKISHNDFCDEKNLLTYEIYVIKILEKLDYFYQETYDATWTKTSQHSLLPHYILQVFRIYKKYTKLVVVGTSVI